MLSESEFKLAKLEPTCISQSLPIDGFQFKLPLEASVTIELVFIFDEDEYLSIPSVVVPLNPTVVSVISISATPADRDWETLVQ